MKTSILNLISVLITLPLFAQESLFNGNDLDGWNIHGTELWYVIMDYLYVKVVQIKLMDICLLQNIMMILIYP